MVLLDNRFDEEAQALLYSLLGKELVKVRCDPFLFNNWVYQRVGLFVGDGAYLLANETQVQDYFGSSEDICNFRIVPVAVNEISSGLEGVEQIDIPLGVAIREIQVLNESQILTQNGTAVYETQFVRGFVFILEDGREISFEKTDDFSEQIAIQRGTDLIDSFSEVNVEEEAGISAKRTVQIFSDR